MADDNLTKWRSILSQLDLDLQCFCGPNYLPSPHRVSTLNEAELENFASQQGLV
jgi:predicted deacetylase